jgi:hypothetical protein
MGPFQDVVLGPARLRINLWLVCFQVPRRPLEMNNVLLNNGAKASREIDVASFP